MLIFKIYSGNHFLVMKFYEILRKFLESNFLTFHLNIAYIIAKWYLLLLVFNEETMNYIIEGKI